MKKQLQPPHADGHPPANRPRVLLVEDDPTTRLYLATIVRELPAEVDCADSIAAARALADAHSYDLWLVDAQLPDGRGSDLLAELRARHPGVPALAHTASTEPALPGELVANGFAQVLVKPLAPAVLQAAVQCALGSTVVSASTAVIATDGELPLWDEDAAARAMNFNGAHVTGLRRLFLDELPQARALIVTAARDGDVAAMAAGLHRLRASCGFVGAARLAAAVAALQLQPGSASHVACFDAVAHATVRANQSSAQVGPSVVPG